MLSCPLASCQDPKKREFVLSKGSVGRIALTYINGGVQQGDEIICRGVIMERAEEENGIRLNLDIWMEKGEGVKVAVGKASGVVKD